MSRAVLRPALLAMFVVACAEPDERPLTIEYATATILAPSCGNAQCHSTYSREADYVFDTVEEARLSVNKLTTVTTDPTGTTLVGDTSNLLLDVLVRVQDRMPYDQPLPENDIEYLRRYVEDGARGAQCAPGTARECVGKLVMSCGDDWNYDTVLEDCGRRTPSEGMRWTCSSGGGVSCIEVKCVTGIEDPQCPN